MSIRVPIQDIDLKDRQYIYRKLIVKEKCEKAKSISYRSTKEIAPYRIDTDNNIFLPFQWAFSQEKYQKYRRPRSDLPPSKTIFSGKLRQEQVKIQNEALEFLNRQGTILLAMHPGAGKTITSLSISSKIGLKTLVLVNRIILMDQWVKSIQNFFTDDVKVQVLQTKDELDDTADFYIMNAINVEKRNIDDFVNIGTLIVDECHLMITTVFIRALGYVYPRYLIGLSATPMRYDGLDVLLDLYFGYDRITRNLYHRHTVYKVNTGIRIIGEQDDKGMLIWNSILNEQMTHEGRNDFIKRLCEFFESRNILILCKRIHQVETLYNLLKPTVKCTTLKGNENEFDEEARVLIASVAKAGVGFSHDILDMLILACDLDAYYLQILGRVFRRPDTVPIVIDIVDNHPVLKRHFKSRSSIYTDCGGSIYDFRSLFPEFPMIN